MNDLNQIAGALFAIGIGVGASMLLLRIKQERFPKGLGFLHLAFVGSGLILLLVGILQGTPVWGPFIIFVLGAGGGFTLFFGFHARNRPIPVALIVSHGGFVAIGWLWLMLRYLMSE